MQATLMPLAIMSGIGLNRKDLYYGRPMYYENEPSEANCTVYYCI